MNEGFIDVPGKVWCKLDPWPASLERSFAETGYPAYYAMNGLREFTITGTMKDWDVLDRFGNYFFDRTNDAISRQLAAR